MDYYVQIVPQPKQVRLFNNKRSFRKYKLLHNTVLIHKAAESRGKEKKKKEQFASTFSK